MPKKTFTPEQIVGKLRQIEVLMSQDKTVPLACKDAGIVNQTYYRWRREYGGLQLEQAKKLKDLQGKCAAQAGFGDFRRRRSVRRVNPAPTIENVNGSGTVLPVKPSLTVSEV